NSRGDDTKHRRLEHIQSVCYLRKLAITNIQPAQNDHHDCARYNEGDTSQHTAPEFAFQVTDVDRQLQRLRTGKHMTKSHDLDESIFGKPTALFHHVMEQHRDLRPRPADVDEAEKQKIQK